MTFEFLLAAILSAKQANTIPNPEYVDRYCAEMVGIPYASDDFSDSEWAQFKTCREVMNERRTYQ
jgi:hypothetical protein